MKSCDAIKPCQACVPYRGQSIKCGVSSSKQIMHNDLTTGQTGGLQVLVCVYNCLPDTVNSYMYIPYS